MKYVNSNNFSFPAETNTIENLVITSPTNIQNTKKSKKIEIIYAYEPLCGWCYGFSNELKTTVNNLKHLCDFRLVNGGIFAGSKSLKMGYMSNHIKKNMGFVTDRSGSKFGNKFLELLEKDNYQYDSKKASIAVAIIRDILPEKTFELAANIQEAFFFHGNDIHSDKFYVELIKNYPIDIVDFLERLNSEIESVKIEYEFKNIQKIGFQGYPACAIKIDSKTTIINQGYLTASQLTSKILYKMEELNQLSV